ncbi:Fur family transcriptional regulator [Mobiluncus mulieris]|uniref:Ferric uptake regulation protein n=1 Tax=Mobiluncus mulieris TaxID=2052 RepID=A0A2X1SE07_9ACTO|nr:transcriptional repressor [Mobiluncus mulieris]EEJ54290.1 transcriptional regulator, Fur family [Mobiluncus mulieris ATCC 35243]EFN93018.1 transcriptional regulator, Fur family [Mobiluncus mulieris FB024-16]MBB5846292.1 Fur family ferric uptake transcriptional regulator [Mobiluncus mulieris]MCU9968715.1 transcriptional repressor [Mobiluncus mulieris]MCU9973201.1 transcriptional repressor [Mobiluncus mulieris]
MERKEAPTRKRKTRQLEAVLQAVHGEPDFLSAADVFTKLKSAGATIGLATVYRNLASLAAEGVLDQLRAADGTMLYRECGDIHHHHHLVCRKCGKTEEFSLEGLEVTLDKLANKHGFTEIEHVMELNGVCAECRQNSDSAKTS